MAAITWTGAAGDGNFNNPANWSPAQVPGAADTVTISVSAATLINVSTADAVQALKMSAKVTLSINDGSSFTVGNAATKNASLSNAGTISLNGFDYNTSLIVGGPEVTLSGSGTILMGVNTNNLIYGAAAGDVLNNTGNLIEGAGNIGDGQLTYINGAGSVVNANDGNDLIINTGTNVVTNAGLLEATAGGGLIIQSSVANSTAGKISAVGANVYLQSGADISGGTLTSTGSFAVAVSNTATLDGSTNPLSNLGTVAVQDGTTLTLLGGIVNAGQIVLQSFDYNTDLVIGPGGTKPGTVTLSGGGTIALGVNTGNRIYGAIAGDTLVNMANTISGAGQIGAGQLTLINDSTINANGGNSLVLNTGATAVNNGLMESTSTGGLIIESVVNSSGGGTILAANGNVILEGGTLAGGLVSSTGSGGVYVQGGGTLDGSTQTVTNTGLVYVEDDASLNVLGTITNDGTISLNAFDYNSNLLIASASVSLTGGGTILLDTDSANLITATTAGNALVNVNNIIEGAAQLGDGTLTFTNDASGIVNANNGGQLVLNTGTIATTNMGLLEATAGSGGLVIQSNVNNGTTGRISAAGGNVFLASGADIIGGTLSSSGTGTVVDSNTATLGVVGGTITNAGAVTVQDNSTLTLLGTILNDKVISVNQFDYNTDLIIGSTTAVGTTTLSGSGTVSLDQYIGNRIYAGLAGDTLLNLNNTITGGGQIGVGAGANTLLLTNDGTISASGGGSLVINTGAIVTNNALIESTGASNLYIDSVINSSGGGTILAASGNVLLNGGTLQGGLVNSAAGFAVVDVNSATLDGSKQTVTNKGLLVLNDGSTMTLLGTITNAGTITLNNNDYYTDLIVGSPTATLTGGGTIVLDQYTNNRIYGTVGTDVLVNVNNTIEGAGQIGANQMILVNDAKGIIDANQTGGLYLTSASGGTITNSGLLESTSTGGLWLQTVINSSTGGTILANGGTVYLNAGSLEGGVIANGSNGGGFDVNGSFTLDGSAQTLTNNTTVTINDGQTLTLLGTITNHGEITLNNNDYLTDLIVGSPTVSLTGAGTILLDQYSNNRIYGAVGTDVLVNVNNLIEGAGQIGAGQLTLINEAAGVINSNGNSGIVLATGSVVTNAGLIEATAGNGLSIASIVDSSSGGTILAAGANVYLGGGTLRGGLIKSSGGSAFVVNGAATLDGSAHTLTSDALVSVSDGQTLTLLGAIADNGTLTVNNNDYVTDVVIGSPTVTLTGTGTIQLNGGSARLYGAAATDVLDNAGNIIEGTGQLGAGQLTLINGGVINANGTSALTVNLGSTGMNTATGTMLASGSGGLVVENGTYTNLGLYEATDGSVLSFQSNAILTNDNNGTLTGGTYSAIATASGATVSLTGSAVSTLDAAIVLSGANSVVEFGGTAIDASLSTIGTAGALSVLNGRNFTVAANGGTLTDNGTITLGGGTFADTKLIIGTKGDFSGFGTLAGAVSNSGTIDVTGGKLVFGGAVSGSGTITTGAGGIIDLTGGGTITQPISGSGTLELGSGAFIIADTNITIANLDVDTKTSLTGTGTVTSQTVDNGTITANGGTLSLTGPVTGNGTLSANAQSVLIVGGGSMFGGTIAGPGTVDLIGPTTLLAGIDLTASSIVQSSTVTLASGVSVTNLAGNTYTLASAPNKDGLPPHRAQIQINGGNGDLFTNAGSLVASASALISVDFANTGAVSDSNGTLTVSGSLTGNGGITLAHRAQLDLTGGATYAGAFSGAGTLLLNSSVTLNTGASLGVSNITDTALLTLGSGESVRIGGGSIFTLQDANGNDPHRAQVEVKGVGSSTFTNVGTVTSTSLAGTFDVKYANGGLTMATAGTLSFLGAVSNTGTFDAAGGEISVAKMVTGKVGALDIGAASTLSLLGGAVAGQTADFLATSGALDLGNPLNFAGTIDGFGASDVIDLLKTASTSETFAAGVLTVQDNGVTVASLHFGGSYSTGDFLLGTDNNGGTNITYV